MSEESSLRTYIVTVSGEILLKSRRSRPKFFRRLVRNLEDALGREGIKDCIISQEGAKLIVKCREEALHVLRKVFGVYRVGEVTEVAFRDLKELSAKVSELSKDLVKGKKFAVRVHRVGDHPFTSIDAEREIGAGLYPYSSGVDLTNPEVTVWIEIRGWRAYTYRSRVKGVGGLPTGVEGRALVMYSGGFDSPVAAWFIARRGAQVDFLHFFLGDTHSTYLAIKSAKELGRKWIFGYVPKALIIDFTGVINSIIKEVKRSYRQVVLRSLMFMAASQIVRRFGYDALVTGEIIGQASSQTLANIKAAEAVAKPSIPILRPLLGMDKEEIIKMSKELGTYELSSKVGEPCSITPSLVTTKAKIKDLVQEVSKANHEEFDEAVNKVKILENLPNTDPILALPDESIEVNFIPEGAFLVDVRSKKEWKKNGIKGSMHISELKDANILRNEVIVLYCDEGNKSYLIAKELRSKGLLAFSLKGGLKTAKSLNP